MRPPACTPSTPALLVTPAICSGCCRAPHRVGYRLIMVLLSQQDWPATRIAELLGCDPRTVRRWVQRYNQEGAGGLADRPRPGRPRLGSRRQEARIRRLLDQPKAWSIPLLYLYLGRPAMSLRTLHRRVREVAAGGGWSGRWKGWPGGCGHRWHGRGTGGTSGGDVGQLLDVDVDQLAGTIVFVTADRLAGGPVQVAQAADAGADQDGMHGGGRHEVPPVSRRLCYAQLECSQAGWRPGAPENAQRRRALWVMQANSRSRVERATYVPLRREPDEGGSPPPVSL
jgi:transposase